MRRSLMLSAWISTSTALFLPSIAAADGPSVAVDIAPLHSLVAQVMDGVGSPDLLIQPEASPHGYSLRPSEARALSNAEVIFWMGEDLAPWLEKSIDTLGSKAVAIEMLAVEGLTTYAFREGATFEEHDHSEHEGHDDHGHDDHHDDHDDHHDDHDDHHDDHEEHHEEHHEGHGHDKHHDHHDDHSDEHHEEHGHDKHHDDHDDHSDDQHEEHGHNKHHDDHEDHHAEHGHDDHSDEHHDHHHDGDDPHAWLDPVNAKVWVKKIAAVLAKQDPANAKTYQQNAEKALADLDDLIAKIGKQTESMKGLKFIVFHDAYQYFERRFGLGASGSISLGDAQDPSPARIAKIRDKVKDLNITCVFSEPQFNPGIVNSVFEGTSVIGVGVMDPLGASIEPGKDQYAQLLQGMVNSLGACKG